MSNVTTNTSTEVVSRAKRSFMSALVNFITRLFKEKPLGSAGAIILLILFLVGIFADFLAPYGYNEAHIADRLLGPSSQYWLGTDNLGRDLLSRIIYGARVSMIIGLSGALFSTLLSTIIGIICGFVGGKFDLVMQRFVDAWMCFPLLIIMLTLMSILGPGMWQVIIVVTLLYGINGSRIVRSTAITIKNNMYVDAAIAIGCPTSRILVRHILPNVMAPVLILLTTRMAAIILVEASLSFLGFGVPPPTPTWGGMLSGAGREYMLKSLWLALWPGLALSSAVYGINMFGDALRDLLDPRLRGGLGRYDGVKRKKLTKKVRDSGTP